MKDVISVTFLKADGNITGKRLAALIGLRDLSRRVLQSQNEGWSDPVRTDARRNLNRANDVFAAAYVDSGTDFGDTISDSGDI